MFDEELPRAKRPAITPGEDISALSVADLHARIETLKSEITRAEAMIGHKQDKLGAAEAFFKKA
ncbi:hypothetical protein X907_2643 [Glycocaulis alkaliphilus]|uniref:Uncharacterized protein n=1 Tax=Glycocaulis alkaliphilus TaxID=1434191 RepID=A0A3T0ECZ7_9PROT|nr:DUF1192 domain-containing protein [Glycocaulis alkaliphilus]AZU05154.1 hypothetical protein X907_2643 [Glycocaulis alkaliphilus]GGB64824.1 hypothetical protein GCM10007417_00670 [Glycocaulis alkaliphilus]